MILGMFDKILSIIGLIRDGKRRRSDKIDQALFALYTALSETISYGNRLEEGKRKNKKIEIAISKLWHEASIPMRHIDKDMSKRCFIKGNYWLNPGSWDKTKIRINRIALETIHGEIRKLLLS